MINETINKTLNETINQTATQMPLLFGHTLPITNSLVLDIYLITLVTSLFVTLVNKYLGDQENIKRLRGEMKELQKEIRKHAIKDPKKAQALQKEMMKKNMENMKHAFNPKIMFTTMIPMSTMFIYVRAAYGPFGEFFNFLGFTHFGWLGTYLVFSIINSILLKKILDVA